MNAIDAELFIKREMQSRWPNWQPSPQETSDWVRRLDSYEAATARGIVLAMIDTSKTITRPVPGEFYEIAKTQKRQFSSPGKTWRDVCCYCVFRGLYGPLKPGVTLTVVIRLERAAQLGDGQAWERATAAAHQWLIDAGYATLDFEVVIENFKAAMDRKFHIIDEARAAGIGLPEKKYSQAI